MTLERKQAQIERSTLIGLFSLTTAFLAGAARSIAISREWPAADTAATDVLLGAWVVGMTASGVAFGWAWLIGRRLESDERRVLGDEFQVVLSRNGAVTAFVAAFVVAVGFVAVPASAQLPGDAVASIIAAAGAGALAARRLWDSR